MLNITSLNQRVNYLISQIGIIPTLTGNLDVGGYNLLNVNRIVDLTDLHLGVDAGLTNAGAGSIGIGANAGKTNQGINSISIGKDAGQTNIAEDSICIGEGTISNGVRSVAIGKDATTSTFTDSVAIGQGSTATEHGQISLGRYTSSYALNGLINNFTRRQADGTQTGIPEGLAVILFQTEIQLGLLDYNGSTGEFTNNTGRVLICIITVSMELEISAVGIGRRMLFIYKNSGRQCAISSPLTREVNDDSSAISVTLSIAPNDKITARLFYEDSGGIDTAEIGAGAESSISILCF